MTPDDHDEPALFALARRGDRAARNRLVESYMGFAAHIARRYSAAHSEEDLRQAAMIGLIKAVDRFDPSLGHAFTAFAGVTIEGELKRHLRDRSWAVRVPRSAKQLQALVRGAADELAQQLGRSPSVDELAAHLGIERDDVLRGLAAASAHTARSLDAPDASGRPMSDTLGETDSHMAEFLDADLVRQLLARLPERERRIVELRCFEERSQSDIAELMGISQMHVSRLLRASFEALREAADEPEGAPADE